MPGDAGAAALQESMKQDQQHISAHANNNLYSRTTTCENNIPPRDAALSATCCLFSLILPALKYKGSMRVVTGNVHGNQDQ